MKPKRILRCFLILAGSSLLAVYSASAQSQWTNTTTGTQQWNTATNWDTNPTVPSGAGVSANLSVNLGATQTVNLATPVILGSLTYGDSTTGFLAQTITGSAITFDNSSSGATLTQAGATAGSPGNIANNIVLDDDLTIVNNGTSTDRVHAIQLTGVISGTGGITLNSGGGGAVYLSNTGNTYSGGFTLNAANAKVVTGANTSTFGTGTLTINAGIIESSTPSVAAAQLLITTNENLWNGDFNVATANWLNNGNITLGNNVAITSGGDRHLGLGGTIGETGGSRSLTLSTGAGGPALRTPFIFSGTNTYTGGTTVNGGIATFMKTASMPSTGNITMATGLSTLGIAVGGTGEWTTTGTGAGTLAGIFAGVGAGSATLSYGANVGLSLIVTGNQSYGAITNLGSSGSSFTKSGIGSLTITGDNTYTSTTTVMGGGTYILDYSGAATQFGGGTQNTFFGHGPNGTQPHQGYGGGTITLKGGSGTEGVGGVTLGMGGTFFTRDGGTKTLAMNAINRGTGSSISFADATIATTDRPNTNGILGGYATLGDDWAVNQGNAADNPVIALASYNGALATSGGVATENNTLAGSQTQVGTTVANTVKITNTGNSQTLDLGANTLTITSTAATTLGGIMYAGGSDNLYSITGTSAARISSSGGNQELIFAVQRGTLSLGVAINGNSAVTKTGAGTLAISVTNTGTGAQYVNEGVVRLESAAASGAASASNGTGIYVQNNAALELTGGFSFTSGERIMITGSGVSNGGALRSVSGANTWQGLVDIGIGGARINNDDAANAFTLTAGVATVAGGDVTFGGVGNTNVSTAGIYGAGGLLKDGAGTLTLNGKNSYNGNTTVSDGTLVLADDAQLRFVLGSTSGTNNSLTGTAGTTVTLNGDFVIDTSAADALASGSWTLENVSTLTGPYGTNFTVVGFTDEGDDTWTKDIGGGKTYTFDETTGILTLAATPGGGSPYDTWANTNGNAPSEDPNDDFDGDGVSNAVEFVLGGDKDTNDLDKLPTVDTDGTNMTFTFDRDETSVDDSVAVTIEVSNDLVNWDAGASPYAVPGTATAGPPVEVVDNGDTHTVTLTVTKAPDTKKFARLKVVITP